MLRKLQRHDYCEPGFTVLRKLQQCHIVKQALLMLLMLRKLQHHIVNQALLMLLMLRKLQRHIVSQALLMLLMLRKLQRHNCEPGFSQIHTHYVSKNSLALQFTDSKKINCFRFLNYRACSLQVSHHPPMFAEYTEGQHWTFWQEYTAAYNFRGKYVTILPLGTCHLVFHKTKSHYTWCKCVTTVHNIIVGKLWIDQVCVCAYSSMPT